MIRASLKLIGFIVVTLCLVPLQLCVLCVTKGANAYIIPRLWHRAVCRISGLRFRIIGTPVASQVIYVANHLSYLDIPVLGASLMASFVAKSEVAGWPIFGFLSKIQQTAFISRKATDAARVSQSLGAMVAEGKSLIIFPEGTSTTGESVLPFRSSLFNLLDERGEPYALPIQPVTLVLKTVNGHPDNRLGYAWVGDMVLAPHLWDFWKGTGAEIDLIFHPLITTTSESDRKELAQRAQKMVAEGLARDLATSPANV